MQIIRPIRQNSKHNRSATKIHKGFLPYGCLSTSFSGLERDTRRRGAFFLYWDSNAFALALLSGFSLG
jgi:hypothetical protein